MRGRVAIDAKVINAGDQPTAKQMVPRAIDDYPVSYTHLRAHETVLDLVCRLLLEKT